MFESTVMELRQAAAQVAAEEPALIDDRAAAIQALRQTQDILAGAEAGLLNAFDEHGDYREHGAATTAAWARRELRMTGDEARKRVAAGRTLATLPRLGQAARAGQIRFEHATALTAGIKKCGEETVREAQDWLLPVAQHCDPGELRDVLNTLADVVHPDQLDKAWARGMDKEDVNLATTRDGFHLTGFLDILTGTRFKTWLEAASAPRNAEDTRTPSQRRCEALSDLLESVLAHGMPTDRGVRPQLNVLCDLQTLEAMVAVHRPTGPNGTTHGSGPVDDDSHGSGPVDGDQDKTEAYAARSAELNGFGPIGPDLLSYLACIGHFTAILTGGETSGATPQANVLDVGRTRRLATPRQRRAVLVRQGGVCANPGVRREALVERVEVRDLRRRAHRSGTVKLRAA